MNAREVTTNYRMKEWTGIVQDRINSGLSINEYCNQNGLSRNAYFYWLKKIRNRIIIDATALTEESTQNPISFQELSIPEPSVPVVTPQDQISIGINGMTINVTKDTSKELLLRVLEVARHVK